MAVSRLTILLACVGLLCVATPIAYVAGEQSFCEAQHAPSASEAAQNPNATDVCAMVDFGMTHQVRLTFLGGVALLVVSAGFLCRDIKRSRERRPATQARG